MTSTAARSLNDDSGFFSNLDLPQRRKPGMVRGCGVPICRCWPQVMGRSCDRICPPLRRFGGAAESRTGCIRRLLCHCLANSYYSKNVLIDWVQTCLLYDARSVSEHRCRLVKVEGRELLTLASADSVSSRRALWCSPVHNSYCSTHQYRHISRALNRSTYQSW